MVAIIDYGLGNLASVKKALESIGVDCTITCDHETIIGASHILLPGVGSFRQGMDNLKERGLDKLLTEEVIQKQKPFLGICLGMQLIFEFGTEPVQNKGLGWIKGKVVKFEGLGKRRIPHMGWNTILASENGFLKKANEKDVYFIHTYHALPEDKKVIAATVNYGIEVVAGVQKANICATQFHPEKSQSTGISILRNFFNQYA